MPHLLHGTDFRVVPYLIFKCVQLTFLLFHDIQFVQLMKCLSLNKFQKTKFHVTVLKVVKLQDLGTI